MTATSIIVFSAIIFIALFVSSRWGRVFLTLALILLALLYYFENTTRNEMLRQFHKDATVVCSQLTSENLLISKQLGWILTGDGAYFRDEKREVPIGLNSCHIIDSVPSYTFLMVVIMLLSVMGMFSSMSIEKKSNV